MHALHYQHTIVLTGPWGLLLLTALLVIFVLGLMDLLATLASGVGRLRRGGKSSTEEQPDEPAEGEPEREAVGLFKALWAVPGKVRVGNVTIHVGWIAISLSLVALGALLR